MRDYFTEFKNTFSLLKSRSNSYVFNEIFKEELNAELEIFLTTLLKREIVCPGIISVYYAGSLQDSIIFQSLLGIELPYLDYFVDIVLSHLVLYKRDHVMLFNEAIDSFIKKSRATWENVKPLLDEEDLLERLLNRYSKSYSNSKKLVSDLRDIIKVNRLSKLGRKEICSQRHTSINLFRI